MQKTSTNISKKLREALYREKKELLEFYKRINLVPDYILEAFIRVPREEFVLPKYIKYAYVDEPLPLIDNATISAISMSLLLIKYSGIKQGDEVLEIGTGSGYQAALIAEVVCPRNKKGELIALERKPVCTIEISRKLYELGLSNLRKLCYLKCIDIKHGDGSLGWPDKARKFDAIIVTAAGSEIPPPLIKQLKIGGRLVMPIGTGFWQKLVRLVKVGENENDYEIEHLEDVRFVPLRGRYGVEK